MKRKIFGFGLLTCLAFAALALTTSCGQPVSDIPLTTQEQPLPSWNKGSAKDSIVDFIARVTDPASPDFVPGPERVAVFDNDGTLWSEQPMYFQLIFAMDRVKALAGEHPEWQDQQPFKAALEGDMEALADAGKKGLIELLMVTHAGMTTREFETIASEWIATAKHPTTGRPYTEMVYQPMLELLEYLRANGFKTYIVSGGGIEFMRPWTEGVYGIPPEQVVGSAGELEFSLVEGVPTLTKTPGINFVDDKDGKPVGIHRFIGRRPIFAAGNSDGDLQMLQYTAPGDRMAFGLILHHDDGEREWAYDRDSHIGRLDVGLDEAPERGWTVISMKNDWSRIFPSPELP